MPRHGLLLSLCLALSACASVAPTTVDPALHGDAARPAAAQAWIRSELYFSVGTEGQDQTRIDETQWRAFLDREVTPRFPDGLTVFEGYGQWLFRGAAAPERQRAKVLVVLHEDTPARVADIEAIRVAWKRMSGHQSVLWSRQRADVSF
ncbi:DUF3574 domain-containing protein [Lysobacter sp. Root604]|uniref:DUF3574 domain-containing protein n=1 Tax=Lysobacter sp. Root604 TaxID=1736568 RepID=UPI0006F6FDF4|nr:DUF3574 domain-containing protein [Lysobacter sp. Root604]KRA15031.1 hypothetical protein ASD69_19430 [Lysobacter sp. Root604]